MVSAPATSQRVHGVMLSPFAIAFGTHLLLRGPASRTLGEQYTPRHNHTNHTTAATRRQQRRARMSRAVDLSEIFFGRFAGRNRVSATTLTMIKNIGKHESAAASQCTLCVGVRPYSAHTHTHNSLDRRARPVRASGGSSGYVLA